LPGRVGDSPIVGAGMFCDNEVGSAGATGRGEAVIQSCGAFQIVQHMANGIEPTEACLKTLKWIADHTKQGYLLDDKGRPNFGVTMYALRKDGAYGSATMIREKRPNAGKFAVHDAKGARLIDCPVLFE
jgi:N4-(beta-N-acetylglucosaminyl)-L-asparaginase